MTDADLYDLAVRTYNSMGHIAPEDHVMKITKVYLGLEYAIRGESPPTEQTVELTLAARVSQLETRCAELTSASTVPALEAEIAELKEAAVMRGFRDQGIREAMIEMVPGEDHKTDKWRCRNCESNWNKREWHEQGCFVPWLEVGT